MPFRAAIKITSGLAAFFASAAVLAGPPNDGTAAERAALAPEEPIHTVSAADLASPPGLERFAGKPIVRVETVTVGKLWASQERIATVRVGEAWSGEASRRAVREILATGRFARAGVEAYAEGNGVVLRLALLPRRIIANLSLAGGVLDRAETLEAGGLVEGGEVTATALDRARERIAALYAKHGFRSAIVSVDATDTDKAERAVVSIEIEPGAPLIITRRVFVMAPAFVAEVGALRRRYKIDPGLDPVQEVLGKLGFKFSPSTRADEPALAEADRDLGELLRQNGFPRAEVRHAVVRKGGQVELEVRIVSGPRIVPVFDGNRVFDADQLTAALDLAKGDTSRPSELVDRLHDHYVKRGFLDVEIEAVERGEPDEPVHYLTFRIFENQRVKVARRLYPCLTGELTPDDVGAEIQTFLEEDLPRSDGFSAGDPRVLPGVFGPTGGGVGNRVAPLDINPATTFAPESYERALKHLQDVFYSKGYLNAVVGPVEVMRARCDRKSSGEGCVPEVLPRLPLRCERDELGLPLPEPKLPQTHKCEPNPRLHIECAPEVTVVLPIHLGPRSLLYDLGFEGNRQVPEKQLAVIADLPLGQPVSSLELEAARVRVLDYYKTQGYAYAEVRVAVEPSPDRTRARAKFSIAEHEVVFVTGIVIKGALRTEEDLIRSRVAFRVNSRYRQDRARLSEERIAALGTFRSVTIGLEDPEVPQRNKRVVVTVVEQLPQYLEPKIGFSTGEGFRFSFEYGNRNLGGRAVSGSLRVQLSYLPDVLILDAGVRKVYTTDPPLNKDAPLNNIGYRLERRNAASLVFPDIGLGPQFNFAIDGVDLHDLQRDYGLTKEALAPTLTYRPNRQVTLQGTVTAELNDVQILSEGTAGATVSFLRVPVGQTVAFAQRINATIDARNNPFAATSGFLVAAGLEHVNALPTDSALAAQGTSHFLKITGKVAAYVPLGLKGFSGAMSLSGGYNLQLEDRSKTYPDRLFFLGGVDSIRSFLADSVVPQDIADCISNGKKLDSECFVKNADGSFVRDKTGGLQRLKITDVSIRGGDLSLNARFELRFPLPVSSLVQAGVFLDAGNLWTDQATIDAFKIRTALGLGLRVGTPIGPLAFDYGFNLLRYQWEDVGAFHFSIGLF